jgi:hypothetical protein
MRHLQRLSALDKPLIQQLHEVCNDEENYRIQMLNIILHDKWIHDALKYI